MKLLCVPCDEPMKLEENKGPDDGSMSITFGCHKCGGKTAMLTNPMETQMVKSLGVDVCPMGEAPPAAEPMGLTKGALASQRPGAFEKGGGEPSEAVPWTPGAQARIERVPGFIRAMVKKSIVNFARDKGYGEINEKVMDEAKGSMGM